MHSIIDRHNALILIYILIIFASVSLHMPDCIALDKYSPLHYSEGQYYEDIINPVYTGILILIQICCAYMEAN